MLNINKYKEAKRILEERQEGTAKKAEEIIKLIEAYEKEEETIMEDFKKSVEEAVGDTSLEEIQRQYSLDINELKPLDMLAFLAGFMSNSSNFPDVLQATGLVLKYQKEVEDEIKAEMEKEEE